MKFTTWGFEEFNSEEMYWRIMVELFNLTKAYGERNEKDNGTFFKEEGEFEKKNLLADLYGVTEYSDYCNKIDEYVSDPMIDKIYNHFDEKLTMNAPNWNQGIVIGIVHLERV